jgi:uncharacterized damage-inducible protein DinB
MQANEVLIDLFGRLPHLVHEAVDGLTPEQLATAPAEGANTVAWLIWHLTRVQDEHVAHVSGGNQAWTSGDWPDRFGLDPDPSDIGYGHTPEQVAAVRPESAELLVAYYESVHANTIDFLEGLSDGDLDRVVDTNWDPPVTLGVRLASVLDDDLQHAGQAAYLRGLLAG